MSLPAAAHEAPISPPAKACEELEGTPKNQVTIFHVITELAAASRTSMLTAEICKKSRPMVAATATPKMKGPANSPTSAIARAARGGKDRVEIGAATKAPELFSPLKNAWSKVNIKNTISGSDSCPIAAPQPLAPLYYTPFTNVNPS
jgi:hypothetical protein